MSGGRSIMYKERMKDGWKKVRGIEGQENGKSDRDVLENNERSGGRLSAMEVGM